MKKRKKNRQTKIKKTKSQDFIGFSKWFFYGSVVAGIPFLYSCFLSLRSISSQNQLLLLLLILTPFFSFFRKTERTAFADKDPFFSNLIIFTCLLLVLLICWNISFLAYLKEVDFSKDIFRRTFRNLHAPIYGWLKKPQINQLLFPSISVILLSAYLMLGPKKTIEKKELFSVFVFFMLFSISISLVSGTPRLLDWMSHYYHFAKGVTVFQNIPDLLQNYTSQMSKLGVHNNHYPPGFLVLFKVSILIELPRLVRFFIMFSGLGTIYAVYKTSRLLGFSLPAAKLAVLLLVLSPGILTNSTLDPNFIVLLPGSFALYFFLKGLITRNILFAMLMGFFFSIYTIFSFSAGFMGLLMAILFVIAWRGKLISAFTGLCHIGASIAVFSVIYLMIYLFTGFHLLDCLQEAMRNNTAQMSNGFDSNARYLLRSTGAILAYLTVAGFPQSFLMTSALVRGFKEKPFQSWNGIFTLAVVSGLLISGFCGAFFLETERIWIFFTPALVIIAGGEVCKYYQKENWGRIVAILTGSLIVAFCYEIYFRPFSWR